MALMVSLTITLAGSNGWVTGGTPPTGTVKGNGAQVWHYTASYTDSFFGPVTCTGVNQMGKNFGQWGQDSFTCTAVPAGAVLQNVFPNETLTLGIFGGWQSDYGTFMARATLPRHLTVWCLRTEPAIRQSLGTKPVHLQHCARFGGRRLKMKTNNRWQVVPRRNFRPEVALATR